VRCAAALVLLVLALAGCESNQERSAHLAKLAHHGAPAQKGLTITHQSAAVKVLATTVLHSSEGAAAVVTLRNVSPNALIDLPIGITVKDARGNTLLENNSPGLEAGLVSVSSLPAHGELSWIDDQLSPSGDPASVSARVGEGQTAKGSLPQITISGVHLSEDQANGIGAAGTVRNTSAITQTNLVVFGIARRMGRIVAAGRAVLPEVPAGGSTPFQVFFIGEPKGAELEMSAPATTVG
jgi:hypothetical protein